jgi:hypothetical protein
VADERASLHGAEVTPGALEIRDTFWTEGLPLLAVEPALFVRDLANYLSFQGQPMGTVLLPAETTGWVDTFERLGFWAAEGAGERCAAWTDALLAAATPTSRLMAFRLAELWADRHAPALAGNVRQALSASFDDRYALDREPIAALSVVAEIATRFASELGINQGLRVFQVHVDEAGATPEQLLTWLSANRPPTPTWEPPRAFVIDGDGRIVKRLRLVASGGPPDGAKLVTHALAFFAPVLHLLDPRHHRWIAEELHVRIPRALEDAALFEVRGTRKSFTCCGSREVVVRAASRWIVIQDFAYC